MEVRWWWCSDGGGGGALMAARGKVLTGTQSSRFKLQEHAVASNTGDVGEEACGKHVHAESPLELVSLDVAGRASLAD